MKMTKEWFETKKVRQCCKCGLLRYIRDLTLLEEEENPSFNINELYCKNNDKKIEGDSIGKQHFTHHICDDCVEAINDIIKKNK